MEAKIKEDKVNNEIDMLDDGLEKPLANLVRLVFDLKSMTMSDQKKEKIFTKSFFLLFGALLFSALVMYALMSTVTEYATSMGTNATVAGLVSGIYIFGGLCSRVYSGNALSKVSWRKIALPFLTIHFLACLLYFIVNNVVVLIIVRLIHGIGFGASSNSIVTIASAVLPKKRFGEAFGYLMLGTTIAVGLGPYVSGILYDNFSSIGCFTAASIFSAIALICMFLLDIDKYDPKNKANEDAKLKEDIKAKEEGKLKEDIKEKKDIKTKVENKKSYSGLEKVFEIGAIPVFLFTAFTSLGYVSILSFYRLYATEINLTTVFSWFFILYSVILVLSRPIAGKIQDKGGDKFICITGIIAQSVGLLLIAHMPSTLTVLVCAVCAALGFGTLNSACTTIVTRKAPEQRRSYAISTLFIFCDATMGFGPALLGSFVTANSGYAPVYYISSLITILALPICLIALRR